MWPALILMWAVSKIVHHTSPCCNKNIDRYYCLPGDNDVLETHPVIHKIDPIGDNWVENRAFDRYYHRAENEQDWAETLADSSMDREDPAVQMIPAEHVNTDNEIIVLSGDENENEDFLAGTGGSDESLYYPQKYDFINMI